MVDYRYRLEDHQKDFVRKISSRHSYDEELTGSLRLQPGTGVAVALALEFPDAYARPSAIRKQYLAPGRDENYNAVRTQEDDYLFAVEYPHLQNMFLTEYEVGSVRQPLLVDSPVGGRESSCSLPPGSIQVVLRSGEQPAAFVAMNAFRPSDEIDLEVWQDILEYTADRTVRCRVGEIRGDRYYLPAE